jgi:hypothetical protein
MRPFQTGFRGQASWSECLRLGAPRKILGEIRTLEAWEGLPRDISLRAIYLIDDKGPVIRWGNPDTMTKVLAGFYHDHLVCEGDELTDAKSGFIKVSRDGTIWVSA